VTDDDEPILGELVDDGPAEGAAAEDALAALGGLGGPQGGLDLGAMMQMAQDMGDRMAEAQERLASTEVDGSAGGGVVTVTLNGHLHLVRVHIDPSVIDPSDPTMLEDLIVAAWTDAHDGVARVQAEADPLGGLGGLGGLLGGG
jgi:nucleoid-associated protein EbfC